MLLITLNYVPGKEIEALEAQLPDLTGVFKKGKRQKCEEALKNCRAKQHQISQEIQGTEKDLEQCKLLQTKLLQEIAALKAMH